tara:strand:+ start:585 stop:1022 length:438 start_codon:yes stop_codon:yes gene_type:complete
MKKITQIFVAATLIASSALAMSAEVPFQVKAKFSNHNSAAVRVCAIAPYNKTPWHVVPNSCIGYTKTDAAFPYDRQIDLDSSKEGAYLQVVANTNDPKTSVQLCVIKITKNMLSNARTHNQTLELSSRIIPSTAGDSECQKSLSI